MGRIFLRASWRKAVLGAICPSTEGQGCLLLPIVGTALLGQGKLSGPGKPPGPPAHELQQSTPTTARSSERWVAAQPWVAPGAVLGESRPGCGATPLPCWRGLSELPTLASPVGSDFSGIRSLRCFHISSRDVAAWGEGNRCQSRRRRASSSRDSPISPPGASASPAELDAINTKFAEAREEVELAMESKDTVYFNDEAETARAAVHEVLHLFAALLSRVPEEERAALQRSMGLKMEQLKAELAMLND